MGSTQFPFESEYSDLSDGPVAKNPHSAHRAAGFHPQSGN